MKKLVIISLLLILGAYGFGQEKDSLVYFKYINAPTVDSIIYVKEYIKNGQLKHEGWTIYETANSNFNLKNIIIPKDDILYFEHQFGTHKYYTKKGQVSVLIEIGNEFHTPIKETYFNKQGDTTKIQILKEKYIKYLNENGILNNAEMVHDAKGMEYIKVFYYINNILQQESIYTGNWIKHGCWKWYSISGKLKKERMYIDGKVISKFCK